MMNKVFLLLAIVLFGVSVYAQCPIEQTLSSASFDYERLGQNFRPTCSGEIVAISVQTADAPAVTNATLTIYDNDVDPFVVNARTYTEDFSITTTPFTEVVLTLATPYPVTAGQDYVFVLKDRDDTNNMNLRYRAPNVYDDGAVFIYLSAAVHGYNTNTDLWFKVDIQASPAPAVPLSPLAAIAALALIGFAGLWTMKR